MENIDLNKPAFGPNAQKVETAAPTEVEPAKEEVPAQSEEESKVPYSRFKKFHDEAKQYQQEAEYWKQKAEAPQTTYQERQSSDPLEEARKLFLENYGDSEQTRKAWENQVKINEAFEQRAIDRARQEAIETSRNERYQEAERTQNNIQTIDNELESLQDYIGRPLKENEEEAILDIVDEYTPKDSQGNYSGALLSMDRAWEIYELKQGANTSSKRSSRDNIASMSGSQTQGDSSVQSEKDKNFNPLDWDAYKKRI